jgi:prepilin-type processing-associated H-X9-DG protein
VETITKAALGNYTRQMINAYRCPGDRVLSSIQKRASWGSRVRSYSMNAMMGDAGEVSKTGSNRNNPGYSQFFSMTSIPTPSSLFVFLDEHPDSINDGYFINKAYENGVPYLEWIDLPASYHNGAASFAFADGHSESHHWRYALTCPPAQPDVTSLPEDVSKDQRSDLDWVLQHMSVKN